MSILDNVRKYLFFREVLVAIGVIAVAIMMCYCCCKICSDHEDEEEEDEMNKTALVPMRHRESGKVVLVPVTLITENETRT